jgi:hypothetical protein
VAPFPSCAGHSRSSSSTSSLRAKPLPPPDTTSSSTEPEPGTFVKLAELQKLHAACARDDDPSERCAMLHAVFDFGEVTAGAFAQDVETFFR